MNLSRLEAAQKRIEKETKWIEDEDGTEFLIAAYENPRHLQAVNTATRKFSAQKSYRDTDLQKQIAAEAMAEGILLNWKGVQLDENTEFPYSRENAIRLLMNDEARQYIAMQSVEYRAQLSREREADEASLKSGSPVSFAVE